MNDVPTPPGKEFAPFQLKSIRYALGGRGTLLADEMGLGKTIQAIGVINASKPQWVLIVAPAGLLLNWRIELSEWLVRIPNQVIDIISYHKLDSWPPDSPIDLLIIDEAHYCKNPLSQRSQRLQEISKHAKRILALTGTPVLNCPIELWPLLRMLNPEKWDPPNPRIGLVLSPDQKKSHPGEGPNFWAFAKRYCGLRKVNFPGRGRQRSAWDFSGATNIDELAKKLRATCMVRRLKSDVLTELPEKRRQLIVLPSKGDNLLSDMVITEENYYDVLKRLRSDKVLFEEWSRRRHEQALAKVDECLMFLGDQLEQSDKIIVFAHHRDVIERLAIGLECEISGNGYHVVVTGSTPQERRSEHVKAFQTDPNCRVFIASIGAAGVGLTLTASSHVIFVELDPVPGNMNQAEDRAHRMGQRNMVLIQHLIADGTLDARIAKILVKKQIVINRVLDSEFQSWDWKEGS